MHGEGSDRSGTTGGLVVFAHRLLVRLKGTAKVQCGGLHELEAGQQDALQRYCGADQGPRQSQLEESREHILRVATYTTMRPSDTRRT
jgi:hypothetical protein